MRKQLTSGREKSNLVLENENLKLKLRLEKMKNKRLLKESSDYGYTSDGDKILESYEVDVVPDLKITANETEFYTEYKIDTETRNTRYFDLDIDMPMLLNSTEYKEDLIDWIESQEQNDSFVDKNDRGFAFADVYNIMDNYRDDEELDYYE